MQKIKVNDEVIVLTGKDRGKTGKVAKLNFKKGVAIVSGVNMVKKAVKPTQDNPSGGITDIESAIQMSNISLMSPKTGSPTRVRIELKDGKKVRVAVACGSVIS